MDATTSFATVCLMMLANGLVLVVVSRDLPDDLRSAAGFWQVGTLLIALGCGAFAFGAPAPRPTLLIAANGGFSIGLTAYLAAVHFFCGRAPRATLWIPAALAVALVAWFSTVTPDFRVRLVAVSAIWVWIMGSCVRLLVATSDGRSNSRRILVGLFALVSLYTLVRCGALLTAGPNFVVEKDTGWVSVVALIFMTMLPIVGTTAFVLMCSDNLRRRLEVVAATDYLTGLPNRRTLAAFGDAAFDLARQRGRAMIVAVIDVDHFKGVNDSFGHAAGDAVLVHVARLLDARLSGLGMIARTGGEEFTVVMTDIDRAHAAAIVEAARLAVETARVSVGETAVRVTISAGSAVPGPGDLSFDDVLRRADQALYRAKSGGRNRAETSRMTSLAASGPEAA